MELDVDVFRAQDDNIFLIVKGPAQGLVQFPDLKTLVTFLIDCQVSPDRRPSKRLQDG